MSGVLQFHQGDNREVLRRLIDEGIQVQSVVTDPPYGLVSITKRFGKNGAAPALPGTDGAFQRASGGFMGQKWDSSGIERDPEFWRLIYEILLPGGYCLAFSSPRTGHWMAVAMEQAGFVMHPFIGWCYGSGFPKAHDASKAIDKELGAERPVVGTADVGPDMTGGNYENSNGRRIAELTAAGSAAAAWEGWKYGAQSMKPALEPIYVAQRPFDQKNGAQNLLTHGVGALNIDGCRVPTTDALDGGAYSGSQRGGNWQNEDRSDGQGSGFENGGAGEFQQPLGRHPANLLHDGSDAVREMFPDSKGQQGDVRGNEPSGVTKEIYGKFNGRVPSPKRQETDTSAARFFNAFPPDTDPLFYCSKASKADRAGSKHPTVKPIALMQWCCRLVTPPGGTVLDPFAGSGTTGAAALAEGFNCILMEAHDDYAADIRRRFNLPEPANDIDGLIGGTADLSDLIG